METEWLRMETEWIVWREVVHEEPALKLIGFVDHHAFYSKSQ
jgi:hypothetical protein